MLARILFLFSCLIPTLTQAQVWSLDSCIRYAYDNNLSFKISEQNIQLAKINETAALGNMLPSLNAQAGHGYNWGQRIDPFTNQFATNRIQTDNFGIATSIVLFNGFQQLNSWKQSEINTSISKADYEKARNDLALNIASSYLNILLNKEYQEITQRTMTSTSTQVTRIQKLYTAGQLAEGNLSEILAQYASDSANYVAAVNNSFLAKLSLMQLLQLDLKTADSFDITYPEINPEDYNALISSPNSIAESALRNFPEIKSAKLQLASAQMGRKIALGSYSPSISASFSYGTGYSGAALVATGTPDLMSYPLGTVVGSGDLVMSFPQLVYGADDYSIKPFNNQLKENINQSLFLTLNIPLFNGFNSRATNKRAEINVLNSELQLELAQQQLEQTIYKAHADAIAALATYQSTKVSVEASQKSFDWVKVRFEQGAANNVDYNDALIRLQNAQATQTRSKYEYIFKLKVLEFYEGKTIRLK